MNFVTYKQLKEDVVQWAKTLPRDYSAIVGVERSGMLPATMLALHLNIPILTLNELMEGRKEYLDSKVKKGIIKKVLVVDDSISSGRAMLRTKQQIRWSNYEIEYGAVYGLEEGRHLVDYVYKIVPLPRAFEWNLFHNDILKDALLDIDGVIFQEPPTEDDTQEYENYLMSPIPLYIPSVMVKGLVTGRLGKYRDITEQTLERYGIRYEELVMADFSSPQERREYDMGRNKAKSYAESSATLFIESSKQQADAIRRITGKEVICIEEL